MTDLRATWDNAKNTLKKSVEEELINWAFWSSGGAPDLGHAHKTNFYSQMKGATAPAPAPVVNIEQAEHTEDMLVMWRLVARNSEPDKRARLADLLRVLKMHFLSPRPVEVKREILGMSRARYYRLLDDAMYRYWVLSQ